MRLKILTIITLLALTGLTAVACSASQRGDEPLDRTGPAETHPFGTSPDQNPCGNGYCEGRETSDNCPEDCKGGATPPRKEKSRSGPYCGDGHCDEHENAQSCFQDCGEISSPAGDLQLLDGIHPGQELPLFVVVYYHVEPNPQLYNLIEPGYFEAVSRSLRQMSADLSAIDVGGTFCFAWLYNDLTYCRNHDPQTGTVINRSEDTGIETFRRVVDDGHELAYHAHPPTALKEQGQGYYARPDAACERVDALNAHRWSGMGDDYSLAFQPGIYQFDDPEDPWYGQFTWERTSESLLRIADYLKVSIRHANGGQRPMLDVLNRYGQGINHMHSLQQIESMMKTGFELISPEVMAEFNSEYEVSGSFWMDPLTGYVTYLGASSSVQLYYPDIMGKRLDRSALQNQGLTFMPVHIQGQTAWSKGDRDERYYDPAPLGGTGGGGVRWKERVFYQAYLAVPYDPWIGAEAEFLFPSLAEQFNQAMRTHLEDSPAEINAWGFNHHVVNVLWADLSGVSDNWDQEIAFLLDISDGVADGVIEAARPERVRFVTMQELSAIFDFIKAGMQ